MNKDSSFNTIREAIGTIKHSLAVTANRSCEGSWKVIGVRNSLFTKLFYVGSAQYIGKLIATFDESGLRCYVEKVDFTYEKVNMNTPHIHAIELRAFADGKQIQIYFSDGIWIDDYNPNFCVNEKYRVKPHKWQDVIDAQDSGKKIQYRFITLNNGLEWQEENPDLHMDDNDYEFRVKPDVVRYRLYKWKLGGGIVGVSSIDENTHDSIVTNIIEMDNFDSWLGDWKEVEV